MTSPLYAKTTGKVKTPRGFAFAGVAAGIKADRKDMALVWSDAPCTTAGVFTVNLAKAAPVRDAEARLPADGIRAIIINSGNANALTGPGGAEDVGEVHKAAARALGVAPSDVLSASTGVIGVRLPLNKMREACEPLAAARGDDMTVAADAILTTDTRRKVSGRTLSIGGREVTIAAFAKGAGMIAPELATMICVVTTDVAIAPDALQAALRRAAKATFNSVTVDEDMSTNDAVFALANGLAGNTVLARGSRDYEVFEAALTSVCADLARAIAQDGEGATKLLEVSVAGAPDEAMARDLAKGIAGSPLVKTAMFGNDPNWGRILASLGARAGARRYPIDPLRAKVVLQGITVFEAGAPAGADANLLRAKMNAPEIRVEVTLTEGSARAMVWGCDFSFDYVKINAEYTTLEAPKVGS